MRTAALGAVAVTVALPLAGCGDDKPQVPRDDARALVALLATAERQSDAHACLTVNRTIASLQTRVAALPAQTDSDIRDSLRDGIANLRTLVNAECSLEKPKPKEDTTESSTSEPSTTEPSTSTTTEQPSTTTTQPSTTTAQPPTTTPTPPPSGGTPPGQEKKGKGK